MEKVESCVSKNLYRVFLLVLKVIPYIVSIGSLINMILYYYDIAPSGEDVSYMMGNIGMLLFPKAGKFLCKC